MQSKATTVEQYLKELSADRREAIGAVRETILKHLPRGYEEGMQYGMIGYFVPHSLYPPGYHTDPSEPLPYVNLASQKHHMAIYMFGLYSDPKVLEWFREAWLATGQKLDMGKSCVRFKKLDGLPLKIIGQAVKKFSVKKMIQVYESAMAENKKSSAKRKLAKKSK